MLRLPTVLLAVFSLSTPGFAQIVMNSPGLPQGNVTIQGYQGWIELSGFSFSIDNEIIDDGQGGTTLFSIGLGQIEDFQLSKSTGIGSTNLLAQAITGNPLGEVEVHFLQGGSGFEVPVAAWKLDRAFVTSFAQSASSGFVTDEFSLFAQKIAFATVDDLGAFDAYGWDSTINQPWTDHGLEQDLMTSPVNSIPGDFQPDGNVDGADFLYWQRNDGTVPLGSRDLETWQANYGSSQPLLATSIPEPATCLLLGCACSISVMRRRW